VAAGDDQKWVRLWDVVSGKLLHKLEHPQGAFRVSFSPDGKTLASGGSDQVVLGSDKAWQRLGKLEGNASAVRLWDVSTGKLLRTLDGHQQLISSLSFSSDSRMLASGSWDRTIRLWDVNAGQQLRKLKGQAGSLSFAPDGKVLASGGDGP